MQLKLKCGCPIDIVDGKPFVDFYNLPLNCDKTWELFASGRTQGVFQLEKNLGQAWSKRLAPDNIDHVAALGAILRPGTLNYIEDGKSMTQRYVDRKNLVEQWHEECEEVNRILAKTYGVIIYQEGSLLLSHVIAGFSPSQANQLKTAISKKKADKLAALKTEFLEGCEKVGLVSKERALKLFENIEASNRYSFNACIAPTTKVVTPQGVMTADEVPIGAQILYGEKKYSTVVNKYENGIKNVFRIKTVKYNKQIDCTMDHEFLCADNVKRPVREIIRGHYQFHTTDGLDSIIALENLGMMRVIDLEVDNDQHVFYGNDILISNSHSYGYGIITYWTAWLKSHFPLEFYCSWLQYAYEKPDPKEEIALLVTDAKYYNIDFLPPSMKSQSKLFEIVDDKIRFGLGSIGGIGDSKLDKVLTCNPNLTEWKDVLFEYNEKLDKTTFTNLISSGALSHIAKPRKEMLFEYRHLSMLTGKHEVPFLIENKDKYETLKDGVYMLLDSKSVASSRKSKVKSIADTLANPPQGLIDDDVWIASIETEILGAPVSCCKLDSFHVNSEVKCKDFDNVEENAKVTIPVEIARVSEYVPKKGKLEGQRMLYLTCSDQTGRIECVVFPAALKYEHLLFKGNVVYVTGHKSNKGGLTVSEVTQI